MLCQHALPIYTERLEIYFTVNELTGIKCYPIQMEYNIVGKVAT
jgi:hypothetical protein